ncbi:MAG: DUF2029 domain-containing protein [Planctomycetes bacterium]|nr:DUF2029 domain-containing protein [Planctomycetota bacterium]
MNSSAPNHPDRRTLDYAARTDSASAAYHSTLLGRIDSRCLQNPAAPVISAIILVALLIIPSVQSSVRIRKVDKSAYREGGERHQTALGRWLPTAAVLGDGSTDPYGTGHWFPTPPFVLMCLVPLSKLGYLPAGIIWAVLKSGGFIFAMALLLRTLREQEIRIPLGVLIAAGIFGIRPIISDLQHANLNIFMMIWVALTWTCFLRNKDLLAGAFIALAIVTKVTPALLLVYFLYKRQWKVALGAAIGLALVFLIIPSLYLGFARNIELHRNWYHMLAEPYARHGWATIEIANQSLYGVLLRILSNAGLLSIEHMTVNQAMEIGMEDMARPVTALGNLIRPCITIGVLGSLAWFCRHRVQRRADVRIWLEFALVLVAMLLMGERTWKHHATTLPIVYLAVWYVLTCLPWSPRFRAGCVAALAVQFAFLVAGGEGFLGDRLAERMLDGGIFCWGLLICGLQIAVMLVASQRAAQRLS